MLASDFISNINNFKITKPSVALHDFADHLNTLTFVILMILSAGSLIGQTLDNPIICYIPQFPSGLEFEETFQSHCWAHGTYNIPGLGFLSTESEWREAWKDRGISNEICDVLLFDYNDIYCRLLSMDSSHFDSHVLAILYSFTVLELLL